MTEKTNTTFKVQIAIIVILGVLLLYNLATPKTATQSQGNAQSLVPSALAQEVIPKGVPAIYGSEVGVSYDDISPNDKQRADAAINKLSSLDVNIQLQGAELERYVKIGSMIACEYCCGATSLVFSNGQPACGCAHSYAMRGVAKYLISKHGSEYSDEQVLEELGKWKVLFFPGIHTTKAQVLKNKGIELNYINLASNKYRGIETGQSSGGSMVGGC